MSRILNNSPFFLKGDISGERKGEGEDEDGGVFGEEPLLADEKVLFLENDHPF